MLLAIVIAAPAVPITDRVARAGVAQGMKAVVVVGPASSSTAEYLDEGERIARQAEAQGMDVDRIFTPRATWPRVKAGLQGANLVVYLGHGNGWPSPYAPFRPETKDGFGLNPCADGCGTSAPVEYFGEQVIRDQVRLARNAVVLLHRLCYASGNGEEWMAPTFDRDLAVRRASNFASGFLDAGAAVVFAHGWRQAIDLPAVLASTDRTMDEVFESPRTSGDGYDGFVGSGDYYADSTRTRGARLHMDPHPSHGHLRAVTGDLRLTAAEWRGGSTGDGSEKGDTTAPTFRVLGRGTGNGVRPAGARGAWAMSPNADGVRDRLVIAHRLSERARLRIAIRDADGDLVRRMTRRSRAGDGRWAWDGRDRSGRLVPDGTYQVRFTPVDGAGNVGRVTSVRVRVLTTLTAPRWTRAALQVDDGDRFARVAVAATSITRPARVTWTIERGGTAVRTLLRRDVGRGQLRVRWDGRDDAGRPVARGWYTARVVATTPSGTMRFAHKVWVGPYRVDLDGPAPERGDTVRVTVRATEPQARPPTLVVRQPGVKPYEVQARRDGAKVSHRRITLRANTPAGTLRIAVKGADAGGQKERAARSWTLR